MAIYAIGDPHLSFADPKPMHIFGSAWQDHPEPFFANWRRVVRPQDTVLVPGDISWAMTLAGALPDLQALDALPGRKILIQGNHDYWWSSISRIRALPLPSMTFVQNDHAFVGAVAVCGTRGWLSPGAGAWDDDPAQNEKLWQRERLRLQLSLQSALKAGATDIIVMLHYPPVAEREASGAGFTDILAATAGVRDVVYGHLHAIAPGSSFTGEHAGIRYHMVACDYIGFTPLLIRADA